MQQLTITWPCGPASSYDGLFKASKQASSSLQAGYRFDSQRLTGVKIGSSLGVVVDELDQWFLIMHLSSLETPGVSQDQWRSWSTRLNSTVDVASITEISRSIRSFDHIWRSVPSIYEYLYSVTPFLCYHKFKLVSSISFYVVMHGIGGFQ